MKPTALHRICARPVVISWVIGAVALESFLFTVPTNGVRITSIASDWQGFAFILIGVPAVAGLGYFLGMFTCWPWVRPICGKLNGAPLKTGDRVLVLAGPHKGTTALVYEITIGQGGWNLARLDLGSAHRERFTDIVEEYSVLRIEEDQDVTPNDCPASSPGRHDRYNLNPQSKPRPRSGVGGLDVPQRNHEGTVSRRLLRPC